MKATLVSWTQDPVSTVLTVWDASKSEEQLDSIRDKVDVDWELFERILEQEIPVAQFISFQFVLEDVPISWREQAVRHRIGVKFGDNYAVDIVPEADISFWSQCFAGDTRIRLLDGTTPTIRELVGRDEFWVYSNKGGRIVPGRGHSARLTGRKVLVEVELDNGERVRCTRDHLWLMRSGEYREAQALKAGDSLMPLYTWLDGNGYEWVSHQMGNVECQLTHQMVDRTLRGALPKNMAVHHSRGRLDNSPVALQRLTRAEHGRIHQNGLPIEQARAFVDPEKRSAAARQLMDERWADGDWRAKMSSTLAQNGARTLGRKDSAETVERKRAAAKRRVMRDGMPAGTNHKVVAVRAVGEADVYDISVDEYNNFALAAGVFVHNSMRIQSMERFADEGKYHVPDSIATAPLQEGVCASAIYVSAMENVQGAYRQLVKMGIPMEDARNLIPLGATHRIAMSINLQALKHIIGERGCVTGDTRIPLLDGTVATIRELAERDGEFWVYSVTPEGRIVPGRAHSARITKRQAKLLKVTLDNGESIRCTADHRFMRRQGEYCEAQQLQVGDSLMPLYRDADVRGYERCYLPSTDEWVPTHRLMCGAAREGMAPGSKVVHHLNFDKRDNRPENLWWMGTNEHIAYHAALSRWPSDERRKRLSEWAKAVPREIRAAAGRATAKCGALAISGAKAAELRRGTKLSAEHVANIRASISREQRSEAAKRQWAEQREKMVASLQGRNHKVAAVEWLAETEDVYDIAVDEHHNYATEAGVFIHNCWILQGSLWAPVIQSMVDELCTKVHPIFRRLVAPPCVKSNAFKGCVYNEENNRRFDGRDALPPCPLWCGNPVDAAQMRPAIEARLPQYEELWGRKLTAGWKWS